jgi:hypothetical protein
MAAALANIAAEVSDQAQDILIASGFILLEHIS